MLEPSIADDHRQTVPPHQRVGEVTAADSRSVTGQCYDLYGAPPLGSLLLVGEPGVFAVVQGIRTEPLDPSRPVLARGGEAHTVEEIYRANPQLEKLLTTRFDALIVGHQQGSQHLQLLPPSPPRIHSFVQTCPPDVVAAFTKDLDFLRFIVNSPPPIGDEVAVACLREAAAGHADREGFALRAGRALAQEIPGEAARLSAILRRVRL